MSMPPTDSDSSRAAGLSRRRFLADAGTAALASRSYGGSWCTQAARAPRWIWESSAAGVAAGGSWICPEAGGYNVVAAADYFLDRVEARWARSWGCRRRVASRGCRLSAAARAELNAVAIESRRSSIRRRRARRWPRANTCTSPSRPVDVPGCVTSNRPRSKARPTNSAPRRLPDAGHRSLRRSRAPRARRRARPVRLRRGHLHAEDPVEAHAEAVAARGPEGRRLGSLPRAVGRDHHRAEHPHLDVASWIMGQPRSPRTAPAGASSAMSAPAVTRSAWSSSTPTTWGSRSARASSTARAHGPKASGTACSAPRACSRPS